jgi:hypothetical protein
MFPPGGKIFSQQTEQEIITGKDFYALKMKRKMKKAGHQSVCW